MRFAFLFRRMHAQAEENVLTSSCALHCRELWRQKKKKENSKLFFLVATKQTKDKARQKTDYLKDNIKK